MLGFLIILVMGMKKRIPATKIRHSLHIEILKDIPFVLFCIGEFFGFMGIYILFFYIQLYALSERDTSPRIVAYLLVIINAGSILGRLLLSNLSDKYTGPLNM